MSVVVMGSINRDLSIQVEDFPQPGETILAAGSDVGTGGKSANQAIAATLIGASVLFIARCGDDDAGSAAQQDLHQAGVGTEWMLTGTKSTGQALIHSRPDGENTITVIPGANTELTSDDCPDEAFDGTDWILLSLEVPVAVVVDVAARARAAGVAVALNLSPATAEPVSLADVDMVIVNDGEARRLLDSPPDATLDPAASAGVPQLVVTHGADGASVYTAGATKALKVPGVNVKAVDTTGCGDAFAGAFVGRIAAGDQLETALKQATEFAAAAATRYGAQVSYPRNFTWSEGTPAA